MSAERQLGDLTAEDFRRHVGARFQTASAMPEGSAALDSDLSSAPALNLVDVAEQAHPPVGGFRAQFAVLFHGPLEPVMPQGTYRLESDQLGTLELFLVPVGPDTLTEPGRAPTAMRYEAVFA